MHLHDRFDQIFERFNARTNVSVVETGTIRGNADRDFTGDGWSTLYFARHFHDVTSIDLDTSIAEQVLRVEGVLDRVDLIQDDSVRVLSFLKERGRRFDIAFLDSDNNADLIWNEFQIVKTMMNPCGLIVIDDVELPDTSFGALKGALVLPYIDKLGEMGRGWFLFERDGWNGYRTGVLVIDADHLAEAEGRVSRG